MSLKLSHGVHRQFFYQHSLYLPEPSLHTAMVSRVTRCMPLLTPCSLAAIVTVFSTEDSCTDPKRQQLTLSRHCPIDRRPAAPGHSGRRLMPTTRLTSGASAQWAAHASSSAQGRACRGHVSRPWVGPTGGWKCRGLLPPMPLASCQSRGPSEGQCAEGAARRCGVAGRSVAGLGDVGSVFFFSFLH